MSEDVKIILILMASIFMVFWLGRSFERSEYKRTVKMCHEGHEPSCRKFEDLSK